MKIDEINLITESPGSFLKYLKTISQSAKRFACNDSDITDNFRHTGCEPWLGSLRDLLDRSRHEHQLEPLPDSFSGTLFRRSKGSVGAAAYKKFQGSRARFLPSH